MQFHLIWFFFFLPIVAAACFSPGRRSVTRGRPWGWHAENEDPVYVPRKPPCRKRSTTPAAWSGSLWGCAWCPAHRGEGLSAKCGNVSRAAKCFQVLFRHFLLPVKVGVIKKILHKYLGCCRFSWMISWCCAIYGSLTVKMCRTQPTDTEWIYQILWYSTAGAAQAWHHNCYLHVKAPTQIKWIKGDI